MGAWAVVHSTTKYLNGHSDVVGGVIVTSDDDLGRASWPSCRTRIGAVPGPWDCFLTLRGLKTLAVRMERHTANAKAIVAWLENRSPHPRPLPRSDPVRHRLPGLLGHGQLRAEGRPGSAATRFVKNAGVFTLAESLGGVESLIELPAIMTHASVPPEIREELGLADGLIRLSCGIENADDLIADLEQALAVALG